MREYERIRRISEKLMKVWYYFPDWRLGQLVANVVYLSEGILGDTFYIEDEKMEKMLDSFIDKLERGVLWQQELKKS